MVRKLMLLGVMAILVLAVAAPALATRGGPGGGRGAEGQPVVKVTSQDLSYDSIITADNVPNKGNFQELINVGTKENPILETEFGPGDPGYLGGRWWMDSDEDGVQEDSDHFFLCPLLGPGYEAP